jgi:hypothetical protein
MMFDRRLTVLEMFLIQLILYGLLWLWNEFIASYVCLIFPIIIAVILLISWIADLIEPARVGRRYYYFMAVSVLAPILAGAFFYFIFGGDVAWLQEPGR